MKIASIVEGHGEVASLPVLLRRLAAWREPRVYPQVLTPIRVPRDRFLNDDTEFRTKLLLARKKCTDNGWILVLLDADDDCPAERAAQVLDKAGSVVDSRSVSVVLAKREFEAWFIAAAASLRGQRGFVFDPANTIDAELPRDAKGWIRQRMTGGTYGPTTDQPAFTKLLDLQQAFGGSRSFRKLCSEWDRQVSGHAPP